MVYLVNNTTQPNAVCTVCVFTSALEDARVAVAVSLCKGLHHSINLLGFSRQTEAPKKLPVKQFKENKCITKYVHVNSFALSFIFNQLT